MVKQSRNISAYSIYKAKNGTANSVLGRNPNPNLKAKKIIKVKPKSGRTSLKNSKHLLDTSPKKCKSNQELVKIIDIKSLKNVRKRKAGCKLEEDMNTKLEKSCYSYKDSDISFDEVSSDSVREGMELFEQILKPIRVKYFFKQFWEKNPCLIRKSDKNIFVNLTSFGLIDEILRRYHVEFSKNIDVTSYKNGIRATLNPEGRAMPSDVWNFFNSGCSIRFLNPQTFMPLLYKMNATLQEYFHCMVGANVYLTPPSSQGFAPHYDDIEAFVLQIEGKKRWKLYAPRTSDEQLPRYSSKNLKSDEIGSLVLEAVLKAGDVLYFPRGTVHQAFTEPGHHSLHITLSVYQKQSYGDLLEFLLPTTISNAITKNINLRKGLPLSIWRNFGSMHCNSHTQTNERDIIVKKCKQLLKQIIDNISLDDAVDQMAKKYQHDALPPMLSQDEMIRTIFGNKTLLSSTGKIKSVSKMNLNTHIRLLRANIMRLVAEENIFRIYYYVDNSREYHEYDTNFIEIDVENVFVVYQLIKSYPCYIRVVDLSLEDDATKVEIAQFFWGRGLLMTKEPLTKNNL